jgi:hypothetical protein
METGEANTSIKAKKTAIHTKDITDDLKNVAVGHAGLYPTDEEEQGTTETETIEPIITLGEKGTKILLDCESGIKTLLQSTLAKKDPASLEGYGLSRDMEKVMNLPNTITGVLIHYLTQGIERDFNITWDSTPTSLQKKVGSLKGAEKARAQGKRVLSKKEKNALLLL